MKQPELGRKIAELRKAKSLTQEELVGECNLNLRTLQRIESGVVIPRSYTVKAISAALEYNMNELLENTPNKFSETEIVYPNWLGQLYRYVFDLFNLKTNTMKKFTFLASIFTITSFILFILSFESKAQKKNDGKNPAVISKYITSNGRGIVYLFPRNESWYISNMKDTADYKFGDNLIQEFNHQIFLNKKYIGYAHTGDTVILNNGFLDIRRPYFCEFISLNGKGIIYVTPKHLPITNYGANMDTDWMVVGNYHIREYDNKIFLDGKYCGMANKGDSVILKKGSFLKKSSLCIKNGL
jgi:transcriptional regulator with XRE-family HTH domain